MGFDSYAVIQLREDLNKLCDKLDNHSAKGIKTVKFILQSGAVPILAEAMKNASTNPKSISGDLLNALKISNVTRKRGGGYTVAIGVMKGTSAYANPVEYGHGGPHPAPAHPFVRPAYDAKVEEAYSIIKEQLAAAINARGL